MKTFLKNKLACLTLLSSLVACDWMTPAALDVRASSANVYIYSVLATRGTGSLAGVDLSFLDGMEMSTVMALETTDRQGIASTLDAFGIDRKAVVNAARSLPGGADTIEALFRGENPFAGEASRGPAEMDPATAALIAQMEAEGEGGDARFGGGGGGGAYDPDALAAIAAAEAAEREENAKWEAEKAKFLGGGGGGGREAEETDAESAAAEVAARLDREEAEARERASLELARRLMAEAGEEAEVPAAGAMGGGFALGEESAAIVASLKAASPFRADMDVHAASATVRALAPRLAPVLAEVRAALPARSVEAAAALVRVADDAALEAALVATAGYAGTGAEPETGENVGTLFTDVVRVAERLEGRGKLFRYTPEGAAGEGTFTAMEMVREKLKENSATGGGCHAGYAVRLWQLRQQLLEILAGA